MFYEAPMFIGNRYFIVFPYSLSLQELAKDFGIKEDTKDYQELRANWNREAARDRAKGGVFSPKSDKAGRPYFVTPIL